MDYKEVIKKHKRQEKILSFGLLMCAFLIGYISAKAQSVPMLAELIEWAVYGIAAFIIFLMALATIFLLSRTGLREMSREEERELSQVNHWNDVTRTNQ